MGTRSSITQYKSFVKKGAQDLQHKIVEYRNKERGVSILQTNKQTTIFFGCMHFCSLARGAAKKEDFLVIRKVTIDYVSCPTLKTARKKKKKREKNRGFAHCSFKYIVEKFLKLPPYLFAWRDSSNAVFPCNNKIKFFLRRIKAFYGEKQNSCKKVL